MPTTVIIEQGKQRVCLPVPSTGPAGAARPAPRRQRWPIKCSPFPEARFVNGSVLHARSTARGGTLLRGKGADGVILTEAAFVPTEVYQQVIAPMVLDRRGQLELDTTPNGPDNFTTQLFQLGRDADQERYRSLHATVYDNPRLDLGEIEYDLEARLGRSALSAATWSAARALAYLTPEQRRRYAPRRSRRLLAQHR